VNSNDIVDVGLSPSILSSSFDTSGATQKQERVRHCLAALSPQTSIVEVRTLYLNDSPSLLPLKHRKTVHGF